MPCQVASRVVFDPTLLLLHQAVVSPEEACGCRDGTTQVFATGASVPAGPFREAHAERHTAAVQKTAPTTAVESAVIGRLPNGMSCGSPSRENRVKHSTGALHPQDAHRRLVDVVVDPGKHTVIEAARVLK